MKNLRNIMLAALLIVVSMGVGRLVGKYTAMAPTGAKWSVWQLGGALLSLLLA